eukprot:gb/GECG01004641.1/.p1 GENE.gb/GECG01004641.1/~~gb/GECG01004641.1/.p1  ORF type:complete len:335 (+),score=78.58 gb/GECG01004641.1/:1-1005(+)
MSSASPSRRRTRRPPGRLAEPSDTDEEGGNPHDHEGEEEAEFDEQEEEGGEEEHTSSTPATRRNGGKTATQRKKTPATATKKRSRKSSPATASKKKSTKAAKTKASKKNQPSSGSEEEEEEQDEEAMENEAAAFLEEDDEQEDNEGLYDDENNPLPTSYHKLFHFTLAQRAPAYDTLLNMIRKDPFFEINEDTGENLVRYKCRKALNKWIRAMNRALEPAGLELTPVEDPDIEDRKHIALRNLLIDDLAWDAKGARNTGFDTKELRALKELLNEIRESDDYLVNSKQAEKLVKKECPDPKKTLRRFCEEGWIKDEEGKYGWGIRAQASGIATIE